MNMTKMTGDFQLFYARLKTEIKASWPKL